MKNKKIILIISIVLLIIISIIVYIIIKNLLIPVKITNASYKIDNDNNPIIKFDITNKSSEEDLNNGIVYIDFYNKKELIYTSLYKLNKLKKDSTLTIETIAGFEHDDLTNYKIRYNDYVVYKARMKINK